MCPLKPLSRTKTNKFRHWVDKNCLPWTKQYMSEKVVKATYEDDNLKLVIKSVESITGDCDVTQRKGKVLCIYDLGLLFAVDGLKKEDDKELLGTITIPEFVHDQDEDELVFNIVSDHSTEVKKHLVPVLRSKLMKFQQDLIDAHAADVQQ